MRNYYYLNGKGRTTVVVFVDERRQVHTVAADQIWSGICGSSPAQGRLLAVGHLVRA